MSSNDSSTQHAQKQRQRRTLGTRMGTRGGDVLNLLLFDFIGQHRRLTQTQVWRHTVKMKPCVRGWGGVDGVRGREKGPRHLKFFSHAFDGLES